MEPDGETEVRSGDGNRGPAPAGDRTQNVQTNRDRSPPSSAAFTDVKILLRWKIFTVKITLRTYTFLVEGFSPVSNSESHRTRNVARAVLCSRGLWRRGATQCPFTSPLTPGRLISLLSN